MDENQRGGAGSGTHDAGEVGVGYDEWRCPNCGHGHPKNTPPCDSCGHMELERVHVSATDFDDELRGAGWLELVRENALLVLATVLVVGVVGGVVATSSGLLVLSDPFGWGYKWGTVDAAEPGTAEPGSAAALRGDLAQELTVLSFAWRGQHLELTYRSDAQTAAQFDREVETVTLDYARYVDAGGEATRLSVEVQGYEGGRTLTVERDWAAAYNAGELSREEYVDRVASSANR